jgi:large subunit ribosomal protein L6
MMKKKANEKEPSKKGTRELLEEKIEIPPGIEANLENGIITFRGPKGESSKNFFDPKIPVKKEGNSIVIRASRSTKRDKTKVYTFLAHLKNMIRGVQEGYVYRLKVCSSHFPIKATVSGNDFSVKNFLGERKPRTMKIPAGVKVTIDASTITVEGADKEITSQTAARMEQICIIKNRDRRIFQDGIYITEKAGKSLLE